MVIPSFFQTPNAFVSLELIAPKLLNPVNQPNPLEKKQNKKLKVSSKEKQLN